MSDLDYASLDPGIRETVRRLNEAGFETTDSGDGVTKIAAGWPADEVLDHPHVVIRCTPGSMVAESHRLMALLAADGIGLGPQHEQDAQPAMLEASYSPADEVAVLILSNVSDRTWP